jgi:antitoxin MazE
MIYNKFGYTEVAVKFAKWGNSIAVRIPADVVAKLGITTDEEAQIKVTGEHSFEVTRDRRREEAIEKLRKMRFVVPDDYVFNRDEIYDR